MSTTELLQLPREALAAEIQKLIDVTHVYEQRNQELQARIDWFERQLFGSKAERFVPDAGRAN